MAFTLKRVKPEELEVGDVIRIGDILLYKNEESRIITDIDNKGGAYATRTVDLHDGCRTRLNTYTALDPVIIEATQEALL